MTPELPTSRNRSGSTRRLALRSGRRGADRRRGPAGAHRQRSQAGRPGDQQRAHHRCLRGAFRSEGPDPAGGPALRPGRPGPIDSRRVPPMMTSRRPRGHHGDAEARSGPRRQRRGRAGLRRVRHPLGVAGGAPAREPRARPSAGGPPLRGVTPQSPDHPQSHPAAARGRPSGRPHGVDPVGGAGGTGTPSGTS